MYERFTDRAREVMHQAKQEAQRLNYEYIGTEHILLALIAIERSVAVNVLRNLEIDLHSIRMEVEEIVLDGPDLIEMGYMPMTPRAKKIIENAMEKARNLNHDYVGTEHLLLGTLRETEVFAGQLLTSVFGLQLNEVRNEVLRLLKQSKPPENDD